MTVYAFIQQEEIWETTRKTGMGSWNKSNGQSTQEIKYKGLDNDTKGRRSFKSIVEQTTQSRSNSGIKVKICSTMFLHFKEGWLPMVGSRLLKVKWGHNQGQNATISYWGSNWQT